MLVEEAAEELLGARLVEFLQDLRRAERFAGGSGNQQAGREEIVTLGLGVATLSRPGHWFIEIKPEEAPAVAGRVEGLNHGSSTFSVCFREKRSM